MRRLLSLWFALLSGACQSVSDPLVFAPGPPSNRLLQVGFLIIDGVYNSELMAPFDVFHHTAFHAQPGMHVFTVAPSSAPVTSFEGLRILPDFAFDDHPPIDVLVVPSAEHNMDSDLENQRMIDWVRRTGHGALWILSFCDGAFVLAKAGLLEVWQCQIMGDAGGLRLIHRGLDVTTFPADVARMREMFPTLEVHEGVSFVHDHRVITSVGGARSYEAALYLCELLYGRQAAEGIAEGLVIDWDLEAVQHSVVGSAR